MPPLWIVGLVLAYLVYEVLGWTLFDVFVESRTRFLKGHRSVVRAFLWTAYSYAVIVWIYALYFYRSGAIKNSSGPLDSVAGGLYFSVTTITTLGYGDFTAYGSQAQLLTVSEPLIGLVLVVLYVAVFTSKLASDYQAVWDKNP